MRDHKSNFGKNPKVSARPDLWNADRVQTDSKPHFTPRRRGKEEIKFPMSAKKALMLLTGTRRVDKAKSKYLHYAVSRIMARGWDERNARSKAEKELDGILDGDWEMQFFYETALDFVRLARRNFDRRKSFLKIISRFSPKQARS